MSVRHDLQVALGLLKRARDRLGNYTWHANHGLIADIEAWIAVVEDPPQPEHEGRDDPKVISFDEIKDRR